MPTRVLVGSTALVSAAFVILLRVPALGDTAIQDVSNGGQLLAAVLASVGCGRAAIRSTGHRRTAWWWLSVGTGGWAGGQAVWSYYEAVPHQEAPLPSLADVGFLLFPIAAAVGLAIWPRTQGAPLLARGPDPLDRRIIP